MSKEQRSEDAEDIELPTDVIDRVNVGVVAVSLSLYEEGMSIDEIAEVALKEANPLYPVPKIMNLTDMKDIITKLQSN